jgi:iron complex transport system substrate-binding protein
MPIQPSAPTAETPAATETTAEEPPAATRGFPITVENCGIEITYTEAPARAVTMNQAATEIMLALGLEGSMVGTAYLDDTTVLPQWQEAYASVPVIADEYPSQEVLFDVEPDFVYGSYRSAFGDEAAGTRQQLAEVGINSYLSVASCEDTALRPEKVTFDTLFEEIFTIGRIFGVEERAQALVDEMQDTLDEVAATIGDDVEGVTVFWYDSEAEAPFAGACCGAPAMMLAAVGAENIFADTPGTWANVTWEEVIARNPQAVVLADAEWSTAQEKIDLLLNDPAYSSIEAVQNQRFVSIPFGVTTLGVRNVEGVVTLAKGLYPEKFE